jgi:hypothetical protein
MNRHHLENDVHNQRVVPILVPDEFECCQIEIVQYVGHIGLQNFEILTGLLFFQPVTRNWSRLSDIIAKVRTRLKVSKACIAPIKQ